MVQFVLNKLKDIGLNRQVQEYYPTKVVGGAFEGSLWNNIQTGSWATLLNHVVPHGQQLKIMFLRVSTTDAGGANFSIVQTNPTAAGQTGTVEGYPVMGSVPSGVRDYPMLEAAGAEVLHGAPKNPIHVLEGSIDFNLLGVQVGPSTNLYSIVWWGVEETPEG